MSGGRAQQRIATRARDRVPACSNSFLNSPFFKPLLKPSCQDGLKAPVAGSASKGRLDHGPPRCFWARRDDHSAAAGGSSLGPCRAHALEALVSRAHIARQQLSRGRRRSPAPGRFDTLAVKTMDWSGATVPATTGAVAFAGPERPGQGPHAARPPGASRRRWFTLFRRRIGDLNQGRYH
jgi:hypothetical protein